MIHRIVHFALRQRFLVLMVTVLVVIAGIFAYQHFASHTTTPVAKTRASIHNPSTAAKPKVKASPAAAVHHHPRRLHITLTATKDCWVQLTGAGGATLFSGMVYAGNSMNWTERRNVTMILGNPAGVKVRVNGKNPVPRRSVSMVRISLHAGRVH